MIQMNLFIKEKQIHSHRKEKGGGEGAGGSVLNIWMDAGGFGECRDEIAWCFKETKEGLPWWSSG